MGQVKTRIGLARELKPYLYLMNEVWYSSIPRLITILIAIGLYGVALFTIIRRPRKPTPIPSGNIAQPPFGYSGPERRIYPRAKLEIGVRYKPYGVEGGIQVFREGKARDISEGGLLLETSEKLAVSDKLEFKLKLPVMSHFMLLRGSIVWVKEVEKDKWYNYGISISEIDPNDRKQIARYVASQKIIEV